MVKKIVEEGHQKVAQKYSLFVKTLIDEMLEKDPEKRPKISEILEKKEIKLEVKKLTEKHPKIFGNLVEFQPNEQLMRRDNKSISFHDYLIKKRNSLYDELDKATTTIPSNQKVFIWADLLKCYSCSIFQICS